VSCRAGRRRRRRRRRQPTDPRGLAGKRREGKGTGTCSDMAGMRRDHTIAGAVL